MCREVMWSDVYGGFCAFGRKSAHFRVYFSFCAIAHFFIDNQLFWCETGSRTAHLLLTCFSLSSQKLLTCLIGRQAFFPFASLNCPEIGLHFCQIIL